MGRSGTTYAKRQKEIAQMERAKAKETKRHERREIIRVPRAIGELGEDPDIAGIVPGPQPREDLE